MIKKILITGSKGMLAKNIIDDSRFKRFKLLKLSRENFNLKDNKKLIKFLKKFRPDLIIHCAAKVGGIGDNFNNNLTYLRENVEINNSVILSAKEAGIKKFINFGSSCMYPITAKKPLKENSISINDLEKTNVGYALSKIISLETCKIVNKDNKFSYKTIIPCNLYGPHDNFNLEKGHMLQSAIKKIYTAKRKKLTSIEMWGSGNAKREFMYIKDLVDFILILINKFNKSPDIINVGTGKEYSINKYYQSILEILNFNPKIIRLKNKPEGQMSKVLNIKVSKKLGWINNTGLKEGIRKTLKYYITKYEKY